MSNESHPLNSSNTSRANKKLFLGMLCSIVGILILAGVLGYGYSRLSKTIIFLVEQSNALTVEINQTETRLSAMADTINELKQTLAQSTSSLTSAVNEEHRAADVYTKLVAMDRQVNDLPLAEASSDSAIQEVAATPPAVSEATLSWWQHAWVQLKATLKQAVVVRHMHASGFFYQYLHAQLSYAMWGALHHDETVYQESLAQVKQWVMDYFVLDAPMTKSVLAELEALRVVTPPPVGEG